MSAGSRDRRSLQRRLEAVPAKPDAMVPPEDLKSRPLVAELLAAYDIMPTRRNVHVLTVMLDARGEALTRRTLTSVHGTPESIAANRAKRNVIGNRVASHPIDR